MFVDCCIEIVVSLDKQGMIPLWELGRWSVGEICKLASQSLQEVFVSKHVKGSGSRLYICALFFYFSKNNWKE